MKTKKNKEQETQNEDKQNIEQETQNEDKKQRTGDTE
jgi:hypothetical protein